MTSAISALGDSAVLLPASALLGLFLLGVGEARLAGAFVAALALSGTATILFKLAFHACGHALTELDVVSPSGHASFATVFFGAAALLLGAGRPVPVRLGAAAAAALVALAVGLSRVRLGAHSLEEVLIGWAIGGAALAVFAVLHRAAGRPRLPWLPAAGGFLLLVLLLGQSHFSLEGRIIALARRLAALTEVCAER